MKPKRILVVDDQNENRYLLRSLLTGHGYAVDEAREGEEALGAARRTPPDLVISDILMPVMDGFSLCREWTQDPNLRNIPFIFYTATYTGEKDRTFALSLGAARFVVKPQDPETFLSVVEESIRQAMDTSVPRNRAGGKPFREKVPEEEAAFLKKYNETLIRKLERKMEQLEQANRELKEDIRERDNLTRELRRTEERFRRLAETAPVGIVILDDRGRVLHVSRRFVDLFGYDAEDIPDIGGWWENAYPDEKMRREAEAKWNAAIERSVKTGVDVPAAEYPIACKDGTVRQVEFRTACHKDLIFVILIDITERREVERQLFMAQKMESVGRLAGGVAHDFNNMLMGILGYAEMARDATEEGHPVREYTEEIIDHAQRSAAIARQLLAFARKQSISPVALDLNDHVSGMLKMLKRLLREEIALTWEPGSGNTVVKMDPVQVDQILANLAVNARDAIRGVGSVVLSTGNLNVSTSDPRPGLESGEYVVLSMRDDGCGMEESTREQIFEPFFTTKPAGQGTGLGLATVHGIVTQNHGLIQAFSRPGEGTTFTIFLPGHKGPVAQNGPRKKTSLPRGTETILLVDDEPSVLALGQTSLEQLGYSVKVARSAKDALSLVRESPGNISLLITDVIMPEMNGFDLARRMTREIPSLRCLYISGYPQHIVTPEGSRSKIKNYLAKPFQQSQLAWNVREVLDRPL